MPTLAEQAQAFAQKIEKLLNATICDDFQLEIRSMADDVVQILTTAKSGGYSPVSVSHPISQSALIKGARVLGFKLSYSVDLDSHSNHMRVKSSAASVTLLQENEKPIVRLEFERGEGIEPGEKSNRKHSRHAAHIQIHGTSADLSYVWGLHGRHKKRNLESLHIPVGGRRFRPTVEDLIEFLALENIVLGLKDGGQKAIDNGRNEWFDIQLASTIRSNLDVAIGVIESLGYKVSQN